MSCRPAISIRAHSRAPLQFLAVLLLAGRVAVAAVSDGYVVKIDSATVYLDWGTATGVQPGAKFSAYRPGSDLKHPVSGEILGKTEQQLGSGMIERVEDKFSIGRFVSGGKSVKEGDRTHLEASVAPATIPLQPPASASPGSVTNAPREFWRSDPIKMEAMGMTLADIDGDGKKEIVVSSRESIDVFRWSGSRLESVASYKHKSYRRWVAIAAGDPKHQGRDELFATAFFEAVRRPHVVALRWDNGQLVQDQDFEGFVRAIDRSDGSRMLVWQNMGRSREASFTAPTELVYEKDSYRPGASLKLSRVRENELFGYTLGDWDGDKSEDLAHLQGAEHLRLFFRDAKWSASENYGGTKNDISFDDDGVASVAPRLVTLHGKDRDQLLAPHNIPELGIRLTHLKLYKKSDLKALAWNGLEMGTVWKLPVEGYLADFDMGDGLQNGTPQLWLAVINPGGKTLLLCYTLP